MDEYPESDGHFRRCITERHCGRAHDFSLGDREDRQMPVKTLRRRFPEEARRTDIILLDCRAFRDPAGSALRNHWGVHPTTLSKILSHREFPGLLLDLVERVMRFANRDSPNQDLDWLHLHEGPPPLSCMQLSHAGHPHCAQLLGEHSPDSTPFTWTSLVQS